MTFFGGASPPGVVRVAGGNGNLMHVAVVAHVLPRHWDGRRLLRFFTGLAMLALAFTGPAAFTAAPPAPVVITASAPGGVLLESIVEIPAAIEPPVPATPAPVTVPLVVLVAVLLIPAGLALRVRAERAPPAV
jgi:hypothetical protein